MLSNLASSDLGAVDGEVLVAEVVALRELTLQRGENRGAISRVLTPLPDACARQPMM
jgi:hypothetical protein